MTDPTQGPEPADVPGDPAPRPRRRVRAKGSGDPQVEAGQLPGPISSAAGRDADPEVAEASTPKPPRQRRARTTGAEGATPPGIGPATDIAAASATRRSDDIDRVAIPPYESDADTAGTTGRDIAKPTLGRTPEVLVLVGLGLLLVALGDGMARSSGALAVPLFWAGLAVIGAPIAVRLLGEGTSRRERLWLVSILGIAFYLVKVIHDPLQFTFYDELLHLRTAEDILRTGRLFGDNSLLPASPLYPGLEILTSVVSSVTGASVYDAGLVIVGAARLIVVVGLFLLYERLTTSHRAAGVGVLVYAANPQFLYFNAQFSYESLGIALTVLVLGLASSYGSRWRGLIATAVVGFGVVVSHHLTAYVLTGILGGWALITRMRGMPRSSWRAPATLFVAMIAFIAGWIIFVASETIPYLGPRFADALELIGLLTGQTQVRELFAGPPSGLAAPWERFLAYASVLIVLAVLPLGLWRLWRAFRRVPLAVTLGLVAATYPVTLLLRLSQRGSEEATRTPEFVFLGVGLLAGLVVIADWRAPLRRVAPTIHAALSPQRLRWLNAAGVLAFLVLLGGSVVIGTPAWARQPGPYLASADPRSIEPNGKLAAVWALDHLGPDNRIVADRINRILMGSYGRQDAVTVFRDGLSTWRLFTEPVVDTKALDILAAGHIDYLVVDLRLVGVDPFTRSFFEAGEPTDLADKGLTAGRADEMGGSTRGERGP